MKQTSIPFGIIAVLVFLLTQCKETEKENFSIMDGTSPGFTKITGFVHNRDVYPNTKDITITVSHISGGDRITEIKTPINEDGTFQFMIDLARPQDAAMNPYLDFLYLLPNDSLHIEINFANLSDIQLSGGKSVEINHDFQKYFNATGYLTVNFNYRGVGTDCEMNCTWGDIMVKMQDERNKYHERRQSFLLNTDDVCDEVVYLTEAMIELDFYRTLVSTWWRRRDIYSKNVMEQQELMDELNIVAEKYFNKDIYSDSHFKFITSYTYLANDFGPEINESDFVNWVEEIAATETIKDFIFTVQAGTALKIKDLDNFEKFSKHVKNEYLLDRLMQEYRTTRVRMANPEGISAYILGQNPKDFAGNIPTHNQNMFAKLVNPNTGNVHVINIGASWCSPCKTVLEETRLLMDEYADEDVCFSFICISPDNPETRKMYKDRGIDDSTVYFVSEEEYYLFAKTFPPLAIPKGILVNRKGVIVDHGTHVRPSELLREKINLLLKQDKLIQ